MTRRKYSIKTAFYQSEEKNMSSKWANEMIATLKELLNLWHYQGSNNGSDCQYFDIILKILIHINQTSEQCPSKKEWMSSSKGKWKMHKSTTLWLFSLVIVLEIQVYMAAIQLIGQSL